jgi:hypothetical protein
MSKITPRPWSHIYNGDEVIAGGADGQIYVCTAHTQANAAHIVKCVNMHDDLVEALRAAIKLHRIYSLQEESKEEAIATRGQKAADETFGYHEWLLSLLDKACGSSSEGE